MLRSEEITPDGELDVPYSVNGDIRLSGERYIVGHTDDSVVLDHGAEAVYMDVEEAEMLIAALRVAISQVGL